MSLARLSSRRSWKVRPEPGRDGGAGLQPIGMAGEALGMAPARVDSARSLLSMMRDDVRRSVVEILAREPGASLSRLSEATGATQGDILHRLRSLRRLGFVERRQHGCYVLNPDAAKALAEYFNLLIVLGSVHSGRGRCN